MNEVLVNVGIVLLFVLFGGFFAAAEIALVSLRESQVRGLAERGTRGRRLAALSADPNRYLAAVQVGDRAKRLSEMVRTGRTPDMGP